MNEWNIYLKQPSRTTLRNSTVSKRAIQGCNSASYVGPENITYKSTIQYVNSYKILRNHTYSTALKHYASVLIYEVECLYVCEWFCLLPINSAPLMDWTGTWRPRGVIFTDLERLSRATVTAFSHIIWRPGEKYKGNRAVASEAICKWGAQCRRRPNFFWCAPSLFSCAPTWGGTTIVCYRLRDNWSGEVGRGAVKVMGPSTYSYSQHF